MSSKLTLDFGEILGREKTIPEIAVADFILLRGEEQGKRLKAQSVTGIILELNRPQALLRGVELPAGPGILYVRLPSGETLTERIHIDALPGKETGKLSFELAKKKETFRIVTKLPDAYEAHRVSHSENPFRERRIRSDRSRWSTVEVDRSQSLRENQTQLENLLRPFASRVVTQKQGMLGIAKLKSSAGTFTASSRNLAKRAPFGVSLVGEVRTIKPTKLYGPNEEPHARWMAPLSVRATRHADEPHRDRIFALSFEASSEPTPLQVACIPAIWRTRAAKPAPLTVRYVSDHLNRMQRGARMVVEVDDPKFTALLQFMQTGDLAASVSLLAQAERALFEKFYNPYAAAVGGYVLTYADEGAWKKNWGRWLYNLATQFSDLPDGHVLLANLILQGPTFAKEQIPEYSQHNAPELALISVLEAIRRGPPMYRFGLRMLSSNIAILNHLIPAEHPDRTELDLAADYVRSLNMRVDRAQPFCVFDVAESML